MWLANIICRFKVIIEPREFSRDVNLGISLIERVEYAKEFNSLNVVNTSLSLWMFNRPL